MRKTIEQVVKILKEIAVDINTNRINQSQTEKKIAGLAMALENFLIDFDRDIEEKLDFLIFMSAKKVKVGSGGELSVSGEALFKQWRTAKEKARNQVKTETKPIPDEGNTFYS